MHFRFSRSTISLFFLTPSVTYSHAIMMLATSSGMRASIGPLRNASKRETMLRGSTSNSLRRLQSTSSSSSVSSSSTSTPPANKPSDVPLPSSPTPPHREAKGPPSKHKLFYREVIPPLFRVLALGSAVYFSLHLAWQYLDGNEQKRLEEDVRREMEEQVRRKLEAKGVAGSSAVGSGRSWWSWLSGKQV